MEYPKFSVLMSIYYKENPKFLDSSLKSVLNQTVKSDDIVIVEDGQLTNELEDLLCKYEKEYNEINIVRFNENRGLGPALNDGLKKCKNEYIFRMDTDDICRKDRFEIQIKYMMSHPEIDVLGSNILEFNNSIEEKMRLKKMPIGNEINSYITKRNPLNHMTVCFKKSSVVECGSYQSMDYLEDYYLWLRIYKSGRVIENIDDELVYARVGNGFEKRRGNKKQIAGWKKLQNYMLENKLIDNKIYKKNMRNMYLMVYCPNSIRKIAYKMILRKGMVK